MTGAGDHDPTTARRFATVEAGGTKFNVGIGEGDGRLQDRASFETRSPAETFAAVMSWLDEAIDRHGPVDAVGIASFGPVDTDRHSDHWGRLGRTPKLPWQRADMIGPFRRFGVPIALDTDVNGAALAEWRWGAAHGCDRSCYLTVGTGIGGGAVLGGMMLSGRNHPEMGHMLVRRRADDTFPGSCPIHADCLEGLASGTAIEARWGRSLSDLGDAHAGRATIADYLAQACLNVAVTLAPDAIIVGGGVMMTEGLLAQVRERFDRLANGYLARLSGADILPAKFFPISGLVGGLAIAEMALRDDRG
jgi:fructokinase